MLFNVNLGKSIINNIIWFIVGLLLVVVPSDTVLSFIFTLVGLAVIILNIIPCITAWNLALNNSKALPLALYQSLTIVVGILIIALWNNQIVSIILGVYLVVLPIIRIIIAKGSKKEALLREAPYLFFGILLFFIPLPAILGIIVKVFGVVLMVYSIGMIIFKLVINKDDHHDNDNKKKKDDRIIIDAEVKDL